MEMAKEIKENNLVSLDVVYGYFRAKAEKDSIYILDEKENVLETFTFPRQKGDEHLSLADYVAHDEIDNIALSAVTSGRIAAETTAKLHDEGELEKSHLFGGLTTQLAEALADYIHNQVRSEWKIGPKDGERFSFGYPACPDLADQVKLYNLLKPEEIDLKLTDSYQMDPEQSTSALIFHHPQAKLFNI